MKIVHLLFLALALGTLGCSSHKSSSSDPIALNYTEGPGLDSRPSNSTCLSFPPDNENGTLELVQIFPSLTFNLPVAMHQIPNDADYWYVVERTGKVFKVPNEADPIITELFLDLSEKFTYSYDLAEHGLTDIAFHPDFPLNRRFFVFYKERTVDVPCLPTYPGTCPTRVAVSEFTATPDFSAIDSDSEKIVWMMNNDTPIHTGGTILFGPDGFLYISLGDGTHSWEAQNLYNLQGSILRIDVDSGFPYGIPIDNPFFTGGGLPEIYAYGLRNPWRITFDALSGSMWAGDVGNNLWEEVGLIQSGKNYGWPYFEAFLCLGPCEEPNDFIAPVFAYPHEEGCSVTGGYVYRGSSMPDLYGQYLFGDFCSGVIWSLSTQESNPTAYPIFSGARWLVSFAEDNDNELYLIDHFSGKIYQLSDFTPPQLSTFPQKLSETGCSSSTNPAEPSDNLIPYSINTPLWSDGAEKDRWMALPDGERIEILEDGKWKFPVGTVLVKSFKLLDRLVETRLFMQHEENQWSGYSYEWNEEQTEAFLVPSSGKTAFVAGQNWTFPSRTQCLRCHNAAAGFVLGLETPQMNRLFHYPSTDLVANQMPTLAHIGMFSNLDPAELDLANTPSFPAWTDEMPAPEQWNDSARAYLHINCAICHRPGGPGFGPEDFRYGIPLAAMGACDVAPTIGDLGIEDGALLKPGSPEQSILLARMKATDHHRMPPLASHRVDEQATEVIAEWIRSLDSCE